MGTTVNWQLPYPELADPADVPADIKKLADKLETSLGIAAGTAAFLYGTEAARPAPTPSNNGTGYFATDTGRLYVSDGTKWMTVITGTSPVTSLPAAPVDGQEVELVDNVANPTWRWRLRWNASRTTEGGAYKWERVGGEALINSMTGFGTNYTGAAPPGGSSSGGFMISAPYFTIPRAGIYAVEMVGHSSGISVNTGGGWTVAEFQPNVQLYVGSTQLDTLPVWLMSHEDGTNVNQLRYQTQAVVLSGLVTATVGQTVTVWMNWSINAAGNWIPMRLIVRPLRIA